MRQRNINKLTLLVFRVGAIKTNQPTSQQVEPIFTVLAVIYKPFI